MLAVTGYQVISVRAAVSKEWEHKHGSPVAKRLQTNVRTGYSRTDGVLIISKDIEGFEADSWRTE